MSCAFLPCWERELLALGILGQNWATEGSTNPPSGKQEKSGRNNGQRVRSQNTGKPEITWRGKKVFRQRELLLVQLSVKGAGE